MKTPLTEEDFAKLKDHIGALSFWDEITAEGFPITNAAWHFHPREFIKQFRKCGWLSINEIKNIYGNNTPDSRLEKYVSSFNKMTRKYVMESKKRIAHLLGQGAIEANYLKTMQESAMEGRVENKDDPSSRKVYGNSINPESRENEIELGHWWGFELSERVYWYGSTKYNSRAERITGSYNWKMGNLGDPDAQKFRGRVFKQLTGRDNYVQYWLYRGWILSASFDDSWWDDPQYLLHNAQGMRLRPGEVDNPEIVATDPFNWMDSGEWYMIFKRPGSMLEIDRDINYKAVSATERNIEQSASYRTTRAINGGYTQREDRLRVTRIAKEFLLDGWEK